jgi:SAM-dependent methyltransferase
MARHSSHTFFRRLAAFDEFYEPVHREIVQWLGVPRGARIADIGCGAGGVARLFAEQVGDTGQVAAVEVKQERVANARALLDNAGMPGRIVFVQGALPELPFRDATFDLVWCSRVVHHLPDEVVGIRELARLARPGGRVVVREGGIVPHFLPTDLGIGEPGLEERLRLAQNGWVRNMHAGIENRVSYPHGWLASLRAAGLSGVMAKSFLYELTPPFSGAQSLYLRNWLNDAADDEELDLSEADRLTLHQLCDETDSHYAFRRDDLHFLYVASLYVGEKSV